MIDPWAENAPEPPDYEARFAALLSHYNALDASHRSHIMTAHQRAVTAAVTAVLDALAAELRSEAKRYTDPDREYAAGLRRAAAIVTRHISTPF
jgi:hypothetical protein